MGDYSMSESNISALKETLCAQQHLLQKLYNELEAEREASATAANEALSVILRLEGEKATVKMEAEQYKRLSEEKIFHAEESLALIEDVIYQKEMEVAALDHQVQAYRYKLLSMGCADPGFGELKFHEKDRTGEASVQIGMRNSVPVCYKNKIAISEGESCGVVERDIVLRSVDEKTRLDMCDQASDSDKKADSSSPKGISSYWDQIRKLDVQVKEIAGPNYVNSKSESLSLSSRVSSGKNESDSCRLNEVGTLREGVRMKSVESRNGVAVESSCSMRIHDVFEVPKVDEKLSSTELLERDDAVHPEEVKMDGGDDPGWLKRVLQFDQSKKKYLTSTDVKCNLVVVQPRTSMSEYQVNRISEIEEEVETSAESSNREEERKLLNEIKEKLDLLHDEIRDLKVKKSPTRDEPSLSVLSEAMLYFWL